MTATRRASVNRDGTGTTAFLQSTLDSLPLNVAVLDELGEIIMTNRAWAEFALTNDGEPAGRGANYLDVCDAAEGDASARRAAAGLRAIIGGEISEFTMEYPCHSRNAERWFSLRAARYEGPGAARIVVAHHDVTARYEAETMVRLQATLMDQVDVAIIASDDHGQVTYWNAGAERQYGWTAAEALNRRSSELLLPSDQARAADMSAELRRVGLAEEHFTASRKDGSTFPAHVRRTAVSDDVGLAGWTIDVTIDVSDRVAERRELVRTRNYLHAVTDSMGEGLFTLDVEGRVTYMNRATETLLGWTRGDLLGSMIHKLTHRRRPDGADPPISDCRILEAQRNGETAHADDESFLCLDGRAIPVAYTASPLVGEGDIQGCVVVFEDISERKAREELLRIDAEKIAVLERIQTAISDDLFVLYEQPIIDLRTGETVQHELLLRIQESTGEIIPPGAFLQIAEKYGLIDEIDRWVIRSAAHTAAIGRPVQINISACSIGDLTTLERIAECLTETRADPRLLVFEITETAIIADEAAALMFAEGLHRLGCRLALDDFGTGYGSFTYLKHLPVDFLKIDIEFVRDITTNLSSRHVVTAVVALAESFGMKTIAEGVEDAETLMILRIMGVDFAQGYHIGRPAPSAESAGEALPSAA